MSCLRDPSSQRQTVSAETWEGVGTRHVGVGTNEQSISSITEWWQWLHHPSYGKIH